MKILLATYWYLPHVGGVDVYVNLLQRELEKMGHRVDILAHHPDMSKIYIMNRGKSIEKARIKDIVYDKVYGYYDRHMPHVEPWIRWREIERYAYELAAVYFNLNQYDLIHTQDIVSTRALARVKPKQVKHVATIHGLLANEHVLAGDIQSMDTLNWKYVSSEEYYGASSADATILPSLWLQKLLTGHFKVPNQGLHVIPYGMDTDQFLEKTKQDPLGVAVLPGKKYIACPARMTYVKGHIYLLHALAKLKQKRSDFVCWMAGSGELEQSLKETAKRLGLTEHVLFLGARSDVPALLKKSYATVLPSVQDNLPFTIMESQIAGTPVIAARTGGIPEMIEHGKTGLLFAKKNSDQLYEQLDTLLDSPDLRDKLSRRGQTWGMKHWSVAELMKRTWTIYEKVLRQKG